jgi:hypothetical protein
LHALQSLESCFAQLAKRSLKANDVTCSFHSQQVLSKIRKLLLYSVLQSSAVLIQSLAFVQLPLLLATNVSSHPPRPPGASHWNQLAYAAVDVPNTTSTNGTNGSNASLARHDALGRATPQPQGSLVKTSFAAHRAET